VAIGSILLSLNSTTLEGTCDNGLAEAVNVAGVVDKPENDCQTE